MVTPGFYFGDSVTNEAIELTVSLLEENRDLLRSLWPTTGMGQPDDSIAHSEARKHLPFDPQGMVIDYFHHPAGLEPGDDIASAEMAPAGRAPDVDAPTVSHDQPAVDLPVQGPHQPPHR